MISDKQALIYGYNCPIVRVDFDLRSGKSTMKQLKEHGHYLDMVYFHRHNLGYVYDDQTESTYRFDKATEKFTTVMKGSLSLNQGKLLRKSKCEDFLYIRTGKTEITVVSSLMDSTNYSQIPLFRNKNHSLVDFRGLGRSRILAVSDMGEINLMTKVKNKETEFELNQVYNLNLLEDEVVTCINISNCSKYIAIGTKWGKNQLCKLYFLKIYSSDNNKIVEKFIVDMKNADYAHYSESYFYEVNMDLTINGDLVLLCYQRYGENLLVPLIFKNKYLEMLSEPFPAHSGLFGKAVFVPGFSSVWSMDASGNVKRAHIT